ncbi:PAS domain-containing protein [Sporocytophaga myxococcoides]|uniref:PAS domain-containing protein n=1 Tax=Sporocytophaga myxococcoides TaxID=153721 RepID=UPI0003FDD870|nr:PAS domain-containing protein [Sporocytophaga myxococcoides]
MTNEVAKSMSPEERVSFLENKLTSILSTIENIIEGNTEKAKSLLQSHTDEYEQTVLKSLIENSTNPMLAPEEKTYDFLRIIIEGMPFPVFLKDENGKYLLMNKLEAQLFGLNEAQIIGKNDAHFIQNEEQIEIIRKSDEEVLTQNKSVELPNQNFSLSNGRTYIFKTHKIPFQNPITGKTNILGFSADVTDTVNLDKLKKIVIGCSNPYL